MKKFALCLTIAAAMMLVPFSAFGLQMMNNNSMDQISGQAGVSIAFDDVQIFMNIDRFTYIDSDGITFLGGWGSTATYGSGAAFNVNNFQIDTLKANALMGLTGTATGTIGNGSSVSYGLLGVNTGTKFLGGHGSIPLQYNYANTAPFAVETSADVQSQGLNNLFDTQHTAFFLQAITIDVTDAAPVLSQGANWINYITSGAVLSNRTNIAAVVITLPTAEFYIDNLNIASMTLTDNVIHGITAPPTDANKSFNSGSSFGAIEMQGITFSVLNGWMEIAPHD